jgi:hypothetical protein
MSGRDRQGFTREDQKHGALTRPPQRDSGTAPTRDAASSVLDLQRKAGNLAVADMIAKGQLPFIVEGDERVAQPAVAGGESQTSMQRDDGVGSGTAAIRPQIMDKIHQLGVARRGE